MKIKKKELFIFIRVILCFVILIYIDRSFSYYQFRQSNFTNYKTENITEAVKTGINFINKSLNNIISQSQEKFNLFNNPKISIVIPLYKQEKNIGRTINSIKNQRMKNIEIIIVNDNSPDNSLLVIQNYQKNDRRIKILNNKQNMGILYSRCIGTLSARGKYILPLDNDDMYLNDDVFDEIYKEAYSNNIDIIRFNGISVIKKIENLFMGKFFVIKQSPIKVEENNIIRQPDLSNFPIRRICNSNYKCLITDYYLWLKCIKTNVYRRAIFSLNKKIYSTYILGGEDNIASFLLFQYAKTFKHISKYGILRINMPFSANKITTSEIRYKGYIYYLETVVEFSNSVKFRNQIILCIFLKVIKYLEKYKIKNEYLNDKFKKLIIKIYKSEDLKQEDKEYIKHIVKTFLNFII